MHGMSLPEIPKWIIVSLILEFAVWLSKYVRLKRCLPNWPRQLSPGESSAGSLALPIRETESRAAKGKGLMDKLAAYK